MPIEAFDPEILQDFLTESGELLDQLEGDLVDLEARATDTELLNKVFRALHTIKGSASFLDLVNLVQIAHAAETALNAARNGDYVVGAEEMDLLLRAIDVLKNQFTQLRSGDTNLVRAEQALVDALARLGDPAARATHQPTAPDTAPHTPAAQGQAHAADGPTRTPLDLGPGKQDLLPHFVADLEAQFAAIRELVDDLAQQSERDAAVPRLAEIGEDLLKTVDFFDHAPMLRLTRGLLEAGAAAASIEHESLRQVLPRARAVLTLLDEQLQGLRDNAVIDRPPGSLLDRLAALAAGHAPPEEWCVDPAAPPDSVCSTDGVAGFSTAADAPASASRAAPAPPRDHDHPVTPQAEASLPPAPAATDPAASRDAKPATQTAAAPEQTIRVEVSRLETLMNLVGELVLQKNRIGELAVRAARSAQLDQDLREQLELASGALDRATGDIQTAVMRTRMQPLEKLFGKYPRLIRDLAGKTGKRIQLVIEGGDTEVDKSVIEELGDPLVHLMRNSADHGLEPPDERTASGKDPTGTITLSASQEGDHVCIRIVDDGRGLNRARIAAKAIERGLTTDAEVAHLTDDDIARFIFLPGFSTADKVSDLSGRGVGMDVVRTNIERLKGTIDVQTRQGAGTTFTITIPLTVAIMPAMMVTVSGEIFAVPLGSIVEIVRPTEAQSATIIRERVLRVRGAVLPLLDACDVFDVPSSKRTPGRLALVLSWSDREVGLLVSGVIGQQEIVIKPLDGVERSGPVSGATVRNDGGVSLIMDVAELIRRGGATARPGSPKAAAATPRDGSTK